MDKFLFDFYIIINKIISYIRITDELKNNLNYCNFDSNINNVIIENNNTIPIIFCLGGMAYKIYEKIIQEQKINVKLDSDTLDFDISFSLNNNNNETLQLFEEHLKTVFNNLIKDYTFTFDEDVIKKYKLNYQTINNTNFKFNVKRKYDRLHIFINCDIMKNLHILELSFWYNNKISDNFSINDFIPNRNKILIYNNNKLNYYLLPLNLLVKTTFNAIFEFLERRNYDKCYKYIQRIKFIKDCNTEYIKKNNTKNLILTYIFISYNDQIRKKYKIINDYPFLIAEETQTIKYADRNYLTRCIHQDYRSDNLKNITSQINIYKENCETKVNKSNITKYTEED
jgi:hypothetical protein